MTKKLRCGVVGLGVISKFYLNAIEKNKNITLISVCDLDRKKLAYFIRKDILTYTDFNIMLSESNLDFVIITLPNHLHYDYIMKAITFKVNVLCEKPLVIQSSEAKKIFIYAKQKKVIIRTVYHRSFNKYFVNALKPLKNIGEIKYIRGTYLENIVNHSDSNWYMHREKSGGGCIIDNGTNMLDLFQKLVGKLRVVSSIIDYYPNSVVEKSAIITFGFKNKSMNGTAVLELDWVYPGEKKELLIVGTKGSKFIDLLHGYNEFKSSLWHEYEAALNHFIHIFKNKNLLNNSDISLISLVKEIYDSRAVKKCASLR